MICGKPTFEDWMTFDWVCVMPAGHDGPCDKWCLAESLEKYLEQNPE